MWYKCRDCKHLFFESGTRIFQGSCPRCGSTNISKATGLSSEVWACPLCGAVEPPIRIETICSPPEPGYSYQCETEHYICGACNQTIGTSQLGEYRGEELPEFEGR